MNQPLLQKCYLVISFYMKLTFHRLVIAQFCLFGSHSVIHELSIFLKKKTIIKSYCRKLEKMGILTDSHQTPGKRKFRKYLIKFKSLICALLYIAGIAYFCSLAHPSRNNATYFSENALLPGIQSKLENATRTNSIS